MKEKRRGGFWLLPGVILVLLCFLTAVNRLDIGQRDEGKQRLEEALHRAAAACYAAEGVYPPDLNYLLERYGVRYAEDTYTVLYQPVASNLMPDITVLERTP